LSKLSQTSSGVAVAIVAQKLPPTILWSSCDPLDGQEFCGDASVRSPANGTDLLRRLSVGSGYNGFTKPWERISGSLRFDGGFGWTGTIPIRIEVPGLGGWAVGRLAGPWPGFEGRKSIDMAYMPSAPRFAGWHAAVGLDRGDFERNDKTKDGTRAATEARLKFRFPILRIRTFLGGGMGVRMNDFSRLNNARVVVEAGIW
jgi:hypothetical protein